MKRYRSSVTGKFVTKRYAVDHPQTTEAEEVRMGAAIKSRVKAALNVTRHR